jgi:hypothetical protein
MIASFNNTSLYHDQLSKIAASSRVRSAGLMSTLDPVKSFPSVSPSINTRVAQLLEMEASRSAFMASLAPQPSPWLLNGLFGAQLSRQDHSSLLELRLQEARRTYSLQQLSKISLKTLDGSESTSSRIESILPTPSGRKLYVEEAGTNDVLCGRGGRSNHHPGNKRYRQVVSDMKASYRNIGSKSAKTDLSKAIVDHVVNYGGRFLKLDKSTGKYIVLSNAEARKKTSQALREAKDVKWTS